MSLAHYSSVQVQCVQTMIQPLTDQNRLQVTDAQKSLWIHQGLWVRVAVLTNHNGVTAALRRLRLARLAAMAHHQTIP